MSYPNYCKKKYYVTTQYDFVSKGHRIVFCNCNGKEAHYDDGIYPFLSDCINEAKIVAALENLRFVLPMI